MLWTQSVLATALELIQCRDHREVLSSVSHPCSCQKQLKVLCWEDFEALLVSKQRRLSSNRMSAMKARSENGLGATCWPLCSSLPTLHFQNEEKQLEKGNQLLQRAYYVPGTVLVYYINLASLTLILTLHIEAEIRVQRFIKHIQISIRRTQERNRDLSCSLGQHMC